MSERRVSVCRGMAIVIFVALAMAGCGTARMYDGPERAPSEVALIRPKSILYGVKIVTVDECETGMLDRGVEVLPGKHVVHAEASAAGAIGGTDMWLAYLTFEALAGHHYSVAAARTGAINYVGWLWIEDDADGSLVTGNRPD